jgi:hypothetical protein
VLLIFCCSCTQISPWLTILFLVDYSMIQERRLMAKNLHNLNTLAAIQKQGVSGISSVLQYAPILLATLHAGMFDFLFLSDKSAFQFN